jgi:hypothetical protein
MARVSKVAIADVTFLADLSGALFWKEQSLLVVSICIWKRLQLRRARRAAAALRHRGDAEPARRRDRAARSAQVIALGDSFHDRDAHQRFPCPTARRCRDAGAARLDLDFGQSRSGAAVRSRRRVADEVAIGSIMFRMSRPGASGNRRPSASQSPRRHPRTRDGAALLSPATASARDAGLRRLYRVA